MRRWKLLSRSSNSILLLELKIYITFYTKALNSANSIQCIFPHFALSSTVNPYQVKISRCHFLSCFTAKDFDFVFIYPINVTRSITTVPQLRWLVSNFPPRRPPFVHASDDVTWADTAPITSVSLAIHIPPSAPHSLSIFSSTLYSLEIGSVV